MRWFCSGVSDTRTKSQDGGLRKLEAHCDGFIHTAAFLSRVNLNLLRKLVLESVTSLKLPIQIHGTNSRLKCCAEKSTGSWS